MENDGRRKFHAAGFVTAISVAGIGAFGAMPSLFTVATISEPAVTDESDAVAPEVSTILAPVASIETVPFAT